MRGLVGSITRQFLKKKQLVVLSVKHTMLINEENLYSKLNMAAYQSKSSGLYNVTATAMTALEKRAVVFPISIGRSPNVDSSETSPYIALADRSQETIPVVTSKCGTL